MKTYSLWRLRKKYFSLGMPMPTCAVEPATQVKAEGPLSPGI